MDPAVSPGTNQALTGATGDALLRAGASASGARERRSGMKLALVMAIGLVLMGLDIAIPRLNISIVYTVLLLIAASEVPTRHLTRLGTFLVLLTYVGFLLKLQLWPGVMRDEMTYRLLNRTFVSVILCLLVPVLKMWYPAEPGNGLALDDFEDLFRSVLPVVTLILSVVFVFTVFVADLFSPFNINMAILYTVPLFVSSWLKNPRVLWGVCLLLMGASFAGYFLGPMPPAHAIVGPYIENRILAATVLLIVALFLHVANVRPAASRRSR